MSEMLEPRELRFNFNDKQYSIFGGSFFKAPDINNDKNWFTINLMSESPQLESTFYFPIKDYSVPSKEQMPEFISLIDTIVTNIINGKKVFVGCFGGKGRTGLVLTSVAKVLGVKDPIQYVRSNYYSHAVETEEQKKFVDDLEFPLEKLSINKPSTKNERITINS